MKKFWKNCKGAVTVMVTLLLIPAILVTGSGVDIARIYATRSILQDANQLAANSALAEYNALLHDLYGLYAISLTSDELGAVIDQYVQAAVASDGSGITGDTAEFKLYAGQKPTVTLTAAPGQTLKNPEVMRRQIEEYTFLRGPIVIAQELISRLQSFQKVKADAAVIDKKMDVENRIEDIDELYRQIYTGIKAVSGYKSAEDAVIDGVNADLLVLYGQFQNMLTVRDSFEQTVRNPDAMDYEIDQIVDHYNDIAENLPGIVVGPGYGVLWEADVEDPSKGAFTRTVVASLNGRILENQDDFEQYKENVELLNALCQSADEKKAELEEAIRKLEEELNKNQCSSELKDGLEKPQGGASKSILQGYKDMVDYEVGRLGQEFADKDTAQLDAFMSYVDKLVDGEIPLYENRKVSYRNSFFREFNSGTFDINFGMNTGASGTSRDPLSDALSATPMEHLNPDGGYVPFQDISTDHKNFYNALEDMYENASGGSKGSDKEDSVKSTITEMFKALKELFNGLVVEPEGAKKYTGGADGASPGAGSDFAGGSKDWGDTDKIKDDLQSSLNTDLISKLGNAADQLGDKMLLMAYATEMFSCYSTGRGPEREKAQNKELLTMSGIPLGLDVNYFYQSELEYIYNGKLSDAVANINSLGSMLLLIRFVMNYVVSFSINEVISIVTEVESALAFLGPIAIAIGELTRLGLALGESLVDLSLLRNGHRVALLKDNTNWHFSLTGLANVAASAIGDAVKSQVEGAESSDDALSDDMGLYYFDYVRLFLLFVNGDDMAQRIANLIGLNVTNYKEKLGAMENRDAREKAMAEAGMFDMSKTITGFSITTTAEMGMLFLSMPMAQNAFEGGIVPPKTMPVSVTDYRGY